MTHSEINKRRNRGFSLVELIIVIAIMAVLTATLAPQLLRYVERSRFAKDNANIDEMERAVALAITDETIYNYLKQAGGWSVWVYWTREGKVEFGLHTPESDAALAKVIAEHFGMVDKLYPNASGTLKGLDDSRFVFASREYRAFRRLEIIGSLQSDGTMVFARTWTR